MLNLNEINDNALEHGRSTGATYEFHAQHYERYRELLERGQVSGDDVLAISAARMLLFHLQQLFQTLTPRQQNLVRAKLALSS